MILFTPSTATPVDDVNLYPEEIPDFQIAESERHYDAGRDLTFMLKERYRDAPDVYVAGNLFVYFEKGNPRAMVSPDVFVALGVPRRERRVYKLWEEPGGPTVVFEVTSPTTRRRDRGLKKAIYARLGVAEYFLYDPWWDYLTPPLQGLRLIDGAYVTIEPDPTGGIASVRLGLRVFLDGWRVGLADLSTGRPLVRPDELSTAKSEAEADLAAAEAENARLRDEIDRLRRNGAASD